MPDPQVRSLATSPAQQERPDTDRHAIPVLAGSTSYALSEARGKKEGLDLKPQDGRYFYGVIAAAMLIGPCLNFTGVNPIRALVFASVFNGVAAVPLIWMIERIAADRRTMGTPGAAGCPGPS